MWVFGEFIAELLGLPVYSDPNVFITIEEICSLEVSSHEWHLQLLVPQACPEMVLRLGINNSPAPVNSLWVHLTVDGVEYWFAFLLRRKVTGTNHSALPAMTCIPDCVAKQFAASELLMEMFEHTNNSIKCIHHLLQQLPAPDQWALVSTSSLSLPL